MGRILGFIVLSVALKSVAATSAPETSPEPYFRIVIRNAFGLQPLKPKSAEVQPAVLPRREVSLIGITTILDRKRAVVAVADAERHGSKEYLMLAEGQMQDGIEVKKIDENEEATQIVNGDQTKTLKLAREYPAIPVQPPVIEMPPVKAVSNKQPPLTSEQAALLIEVQRMKYKQDGDPTANILPPTDLTDESAGVIPQPESN